MRQISPTKSSDQLRGVMLPGCKIFYKGCRLNIQNKRLKAKFIKRCGDSLWICYFHHKIDVNKSLFHTGTENRTDETTGDGIVLTTRPAGRNLHLHG